SDIGAAPSALATRPMDTASSPSVSATATAASTILARLRSGFGPLCGRSRTPQAAATSAGISLASVDGALWPAIFVSSRDPVDIILVLRIAYAYQRMTYAEGMKD